MSRAAFNVLRRNFSTSLRRAGDDCPENFYMCRDSAYKKVMVAQEHFSTPSAVEFTHQRKPFADVINGSAWIFSFICLIPIYQWQKYLRKPKVD